jgi:hypothetical protein
MKSVGIRGSVVAAVTSIFVLGYGTTTPVHAQQAALAANPELAAKGAWNSGTTYVIDDIVTSRGSTWRSKRNNNTNRVPGQTQPSTAAFWELFARGFNPTGAWLNSIKYQPDDLVTRSGQTWRAKRTIAAGGAVPVAGANWELFAAKGAMGEQGEQGPAGPNTGISAGNQSAPGISFSGDPDTGIYQPENNKIALVAGGTLFVHNVGTNNAALGLGALANGGGLNNTAVGSNALAGPSGGGNTAVGNLALSANTTAVNNTAVGDAALTLNLTGSNNTAVGAAALTNNTTGGNSTALGQSALGANTSGIGNTAVGYRALMANTTGNNNLAIGTEVLHVNTTGSFNIALGSGAAGGNTTADSNVAIGINALATNQTGNNNVAIGRDALTYSTTADNTAIGYQALYLATTGDGNTAVGSSALSANTTGGANVAVGSNALASNTTAVNNTAVGYNALLSTTTASSNTAVGIGALQSNTTGTANAALGNGAGSAATNPSSSIFIGNVGLAADTTTIKIGTQGTQTSTYIAGIYSRTVDSNTDVPLIIDIEGKLGTTISSRRYKFDIEPMADMSAMLGKLRPVTFRYKEAPNGQHPLQYGLIAEEVAEVFPGLAVLNKDGSAETVKYHLLPSFLLAGYQAQQKTIAAQADEIAELKQRLAAIEAMLPRTMKAAAR